MDLLGNGGVMIQLAAASANPELTRPIFNQDVYLSLAQLICFDSACSDKSKCISVTYPRNDFSGDFDLILMHYPDGLVSIMAWVCSLE